MLCAISGEAPQEPVASKKSGNVFEKRLIESYIAENGKDPVTGEETSVDDLVDLKSARVVKPRPPQITSIPALLNVFQNEWDALALESFTLQQQLSLLRQELSTSLYNNDAAIRVIARLTKERDEARDALARVSVNDQRSAAAGGDAMQVDSESLPEEIAEKVERTQESLSKTRRKRPVPEGWATVEDIQSLKMPKKSAKTKIPPGSRALAVDHVRDLALIGGVDGKGYLLSLSTSKQQGAINFDEAAITDALFWEHINQTRLIVASSTGSVSIYEDENADAASFTFNTHAGPTSGIAMHPSNEVLASVSTDKSVVLYDLIGKKVLRQNYTETKLTCCQFHPDGHLLAAGGQDGQIRIFDVMSGTIAAKFDLAGPLQDLSFSENGVWLAAVVQGSTSVPIWNLRKAAEVESIDFGSRIDSIEWDYTGQYLAGAGPGCVAVQHYDKAAKAWSEPLRKAANVSTVRWGSLAKSLVVLTEKGALDVLN